MTNRFEFVDPDGDRLFVLPGPAADGTPAIGVAVELGDAPFGVVVPLARVEEVVAGLRDMARQAGGQAAPEPVRPPWPSRERWRVETLDPVSGEWAPGLAIGSLGEARERYTHLEKSAPAWRHDGSPVRRRIVRETTTHTVEET